MKSSLKFIINIIGLFIFMYLCGSFAQLSFDISKWTEEARNALIFGYVLFSLLYVIIEYCLEMDNNEN